jgi:hypothetical protein
MDQFKYFLDGPGEALIVTSDFDAASPDLSKILCVVTAKTAAFRSGTTEEKVTGGRSIFPRRKILTDREVTFELSDCEMDFRYVSLSQGEDIVITSVDAWAFGEDEQYTIGETVDNTVTLRHTPIKDTLVVQDMEGNLFVTAAAAEAGVSYSLDTDTLTFAVGDDGKEIKAFYQYEESSVQQVSTKNDSLPKTVKIIHHQPTFDEDNARIGTQEIEIYKAQVGGEFEESFEERSPFAPSLTFELVDPRRADKKVVDHRYIPVAGATS